MTLTVAPLRLPLDVTSGFGVIRRLRLSDGTIREGPHMGVDLEAEMGEPVFAMGDGVVDFVGRNPDGSCGLDVGIVDDDDGRYLLCHLSKIPSHVKKGLRVKAGDVVGFAGDTGPVTGPHLHIQWWPTWPSSTLQDIEPVLPFLVEPPKVVGLSPSGAVVVVGVTLSALAIAALASRRRKAQR